MKTSHHRKVLQNKNQQTAGTEHTFSMATAAMAEVYRKFSVYEGVYDSQLEEPWSLSSQIVLFSLGLGGELNNELLLEAIEL